jgi:hypothetical protein
MGTRTHIKHLIICMAHNLRLHTKHRDSNENGRNSLLLTFEAMNVHAYVQEVSFLLVRDGIMFFLLRMRLWEAMTLALKGIIRTHT